MAAVRYDCKEAVDGKLSAHLLVQQIGTEECSNTLPRVSNTIRT